MLSAGCIMAGSLAVLHAARQPTRFWPGYLAIVVYITAYLDIVVKNISFKSSDMDIRNVRIMKIQND